MLSHTLDCVLLLLLLVLLLLLLLLLAMYMLSHLETVRRKL